MKFTKLHDFSENQENHENGPQNHCFRIGFLVVFAYGRKINFLRENQIFLEKLENQ